MDVAADWHFLWLHYHKDWVDVGTFVTAGLWALFRWSRRRFKAKPVALGRWAMDGSTIFPLAVLSASVLSRKAIEALLSASRVTLAIAGLFALLSVITLDEQA